MRINTEYRSDASEIMDDFSLKGEMLADALDKIAKINQLLGGNKLTLEGIKKLIKNIPHQNEICIIDLGCGNGDMLRCLADYGLDNHYNFKLIGVDANAFTVNYAKKNSIQYADIDYLSEDIFNFPFDDFKIDIVLCTLTLHHFKDEEIIRLMKTVVRHAQIGTIVNDLQRSKLAYKLFQILCFVFRLNKMSRQDGLISILRGFKKTDLLAFSKKLKLSRYTIEWKWAFRYQWIIYKS